MAISNAYQPHPSLQSSLSFEYFRCRKLLLYRFTVFAPILITVGVMVIMMLVKLGSTYNDSSNSIGNKITAIETANAVMLSAIAASYGILIFIACGQLVATEYRHNTIKMVAIRQPNRQQVVLAKALAGLGIVVSTMLVFLVCWLVFCFFMKFYMGESLSFSNKDLNDLTSGLWYLVIVTFRTYLLSILVMTLTLMFKSIVAGIITYFIYNAADGYLSSLLSQNAFGFASGSSTNSQNAVLKFFNTFTLNRNLSLLEASPGNVGLTGSSSGVASTDGPVWLACIILLIYLVLYLGLAVLIFTRRDIAE